jgi:protein-disulfide isomerase
LVPLLAVAPLVIAQAPDQRLAREKIISYVRAHFDIPESVKVTMTDLRESAFPDYLETTVTLDDGKEKRSQPMFVSKNMRYLVAGSIFNLGGDPRDLITRLISLEEQSTQGPASAPVTLVEYSDLECPVCARFHEELETEIVPKYGDKLRIVFKEYPLVNIHEWALTGAIAAQCTYQIDPSKYVTFRSLVYKNQETVDASRVRDTLLHFGAQAGVDNMKLAACIDSKASLSRVEANMREGEALGVSQTPTSYINGRPVIGAPPSADLDKIIEEAIRDNK